MPALFLFIPGGSIHTEPAEPEDRREVLRMVAGAVCILQMAMALSYAAPAWPGVAQALQLPFGGTLTIDLLGRCAVHDRHGGADASSRRPRNRLDFTNLVLVAMMA